MDKLLKITNWINSKGKMILPLLFGLLLLNPLLAISQPSSPTGNGGTSGGNPDSNNPTPAVPFDPKMNILLLLIAVVFIVMVLRKRNKIEANSN